MLSALLAEIPGVVPQARDERVTRNPHYMMIFRIPGLDEFRRNDLVDRLIERGLPAFAAFRAVYRSEGFWETAAPDLTVDELAARCPNTEAIYSDCVWLHHRTLLGTGEQMHPDSRDRRRPPCGPASDRRGARHGPGARPVAMVGLG